MIITVYIMCLIITYPEESSVSGRNIGNSFVDFCG